MAEDMVKRMSGRGNPRALFVLLALLGGCGLPSGSAPAPTDTHSGPPIVETGAPEGYDQFRDACAEAGREWQEAQVDFYKVFFLEQGRATNYTAAVDARERPLPAEEVLEDPSGESGSEKVYVQCVMAARLVPIGSEIKVEAGSQGDGEWLYREFTPSGVLEWAWSVTATAPRDQQLRLDLRPVVRWNGYPDGAYQAQIASYTTNVVVNGSVLQRVSYWFDTDYPLLKKLFGILGAALLSLLVFGRKLLGDERYERLLERLLPRGKSRMKSSAAPPKPDH